MDLIVGIFMVCCAIAILILAFVMLIKAAHEPNAKKKTLYDCLDFTPDWDDEPLR